MPQDRFWESKSLAQMSLREWEALCDGCGRCCLHKLEDEDTGEVFYTSVACKNLDIKLCQCKDYPNRKRLVPECITLDITKVAEFDWLPESCAYRLLNNGERLPQWHPLVSGSTKTVHRSNTSVKNIAVSELKVNPDDYQEYILKWVR